MSDNIFVAILTGWDRAQSSEMFTSNEVHYDGNNDAWRIVDKTPCSWARYHIAPGYFRQPKRWNLEKPDIIFNLISDTDQNPQTLGIAEQMTASARPRLINDPQHVFGTGREEISKLLRDVPGLIVPSVIRMQAPTYSQLSARVEAEGFNFPAIVRHPGTHTGTVLGIFNQLEDLRSVLETNDQDLILTEFKDFRSPDGLYRKMRVFFVGDQVVFRHLLQSEDWNVHARTRREFMTERPDFIREEEEMVHTGGVAILEPARDALEAIQKLVQLDYFGVDFAVAPDGQLLIFEINATMNFFPFPEDPRFLYLQTSLNHAVRAMTQLLQERVDQQPLINA